MKGRPADRQALHWLLVLFAGLSLMAFAAVANLAWMLASVGAFDPLAAALVGKSWVAILAALLVPAVVGMAGAFLWYTVRWRAVLAEGYPAYRVHDARLSLSLALGAMLVAIAAHGSLYWAGNPRCVELCGLYAFAALFLANLFVAVIGASGLALAGLDGEAFLVCLLLLPATLVTPLWAYGAADTPALSVPWNTVGVACLLVVLVRLARAHPTATAPPT